jgi:RHS repeat-associated protein
MFPITDGALTFSPVAPTQGSLTASNVDFMVQGTMGPVQLTDFSMGGPLNPTVFQLTAEDGTVYVIDEKLGVTSQKDRNGNTLEIGPSGIIHSSGKSVTFTRDGQGRISKITDPAGKELTYSYDAAGNLASSTDRTGNVTTYSYNATHGLLTVVDPRGVQAQKNVYDSDGRLVSITDANGKTISYTHNLSARQEVVTDRLGGVTVLEYDTNGNIVQETDSLGGVTTRTFDARDNLLTETNPLGKTTTNTYDGADQLLSTTDPLGNKTSYTYAAFRKVATTTDPLGHVTTNSYDGGGNLLSTTDAAGKTTSYTYDLQGLPLTRTDRNGKVTSFEYDGAGNLTKQTDVLGNATSFTYDTLGRKLTSTRSRTGPLGPETLTTTWEYDAQGRQTAVIYPDGSKTKTTYNAFGKPATTVDQLNRSTSYTYDQRGQLSTTTYPDGTSESITYDDEGRETSRTDRGGRTTSYERDALGRLTKTAYADGSTRKSGYDSAGREMSSTDELGNTTTYGFDAAGRRTTVTDPLGNVTATGYDAEGNAVTVTDANGHTTTTSYDPENRPIKVTYADGTFSSTAYDNEGRRTSQTDAAGITTSFGYDAVGQLVQVTDALGGITKYGYDELGNRISQTDANNHTTSFEYDKLGRRTKRILPLGQVETLGYDAAGNLTSRTDFNGKTTSYTFDSSNRLLSKTPDASFGAAAVSFTYTPAGRRASMVDGTGTASYTYDVRDRLLRKATPFGTLTMSYDLAGGRLTLRSDKPDGVSVDYGWDAARRLSSVTDKSAGGGATSYSYNLAGNLVGYEYPNGVKVTLTRDALDRVKKLAALDPSNQPLASYEYTFGPAGNRTSLTELSGRTVTWSYDNLYRLTKETVAGGSVNGSISYTLDAVGNRLTRSSTVPPIPSATSSCDANDRLFSDTYDAEGSTTAAGANSYSYDFEARLSAFNASQVTLVYDGDGHLVSRTVGGATTTYLVDEGNPTGYTQVAEERVGGAVNKALVFGLQLISQRQMVSGAWTRSYYGFDGHGHVRYLTDASGAVADTYDFDAFGSPLSSTGGTPNDYRYVGERWDSNLGLVYLRARYLDGSKGRFVTADPAEGVSTTPLSLNRYSYADADPVNRRDPLGTWSTAAWGIVIHGIIGRQFVEGNPNTRRSNRWLSTVVGTALEIDGSLAADIGADARLRPDLVDLATNEVYEIKPAGSEREGWAQLDSYIALLNHYTWPLWGQSRWRRGTSWHYKPLETWIPIPLTYVDYLVHATDNGLIVYDVSRERLYRLYRAVLYEYMVGALLTRLLSLPSLARLAL